MKEFRYIWVLGLIATALIIAVPVILFASSADATSPDPWDYVQPTVAPTNHAALMTGPYATGQEVTAACLECHEDAATQMMQTTHWTWESEPLMLPGRDEPVTVGKKNQLNNFCIGIQGNWTGCTRCHAGYGWEDANFDFTQETAVDCLVCHADPNIYAKGNSGLPAEGVDLALAAGSVGRPTRQNCGSCHFNGGGGNAVKHGDLDESLYYPDAEQDVHMGEHDFECVDCHGGEDHNILGHMISVSPQDNDTLSCTNCHAADLHEDPRIDEHVATVACQTCHIPEGATRYATKVDWDWSTAGQDLPEDPHVYLKIKGNFIYEHDLQPTYQWYNGNGDRYIVGDLIDPTQVTDISVPIGDISDPESKIWPFKTHTARQPYDVLNQYLLIPKTVGPGGFWTDFDWDQAFRLNEANTGLAYSGEYGFAPTRMQWIMTHQVQPKENALQCYDCHGENGRMDWQALGYFGDPISWGGRAQQAGTPQTGLPLAESN
jgi:octaheme c-type cytochrome (tetrathionate reductase family)